MSEFKTCPHCDGEILSKAIKCKYCKELINGTTEQIDTEQTKRIKGTSPAGIALGVFMGLFVLAIIILFPSCGTTHYSLKEVADNGELGDRVELEVARITPFFGGVAGDGDPYAFGVYDKSVDGPGGPAVIIVIVWERNNPFTPEAGDFITLKGELEEELRDNTIISMQQMGWNHMEETGKALIIRANDIKRASRPAGW